MLDLASLKQPNGRNQYLAAPQGFGIAQPDRITPLFPRPAADLAQLFLAMALKQPRVTLRRQRQDGLGFELVQRSRLFRFPDIISVEVIPVDERRSSLAIFSRSVYGRRDFGVNRNRVEDWLARLARL